MILNPGGSLGGSGLGDEENVPRCQEPQAGEPSPTFRCERKRGPEKSGCICWWQDQGQGMVYVPGHSFFRVSCP